MSSLTFDQQSAIKSGLFLGSSGSASLVSGSANSDYISSQPYSDNSEYGGYVGVTDFYLVYDNSAKVFEVAGVAAGKTKYVSGHVVPSYSSYSVLYTVPNEAAESLGLSVPSSTDKKNFSRMLLPIRL